MANNFAEAFLGARNLAQDRIRQQQEQAQASQMRQTQFEQTQQDRGQNQLLGMARGWKTVQPQNRQAYYERFIKPAITQQFGDPGPYDEQAIDGIADQILAAYGSQGPSGAVQSTYVDAAGNRVAIMRDGTTAILGQNAPNTQIIDTGNGFFGVNKGNLSAKPVMIGGGQPAAQIPAGGMFTGPDGMPTRIDPSLPPAVQQAIMADPNAWNAAPDGASAQLPPQQTGAQLRSAPKAPAVPSGYAVNPDGTMTAIPGGPADVARQAREDAAAARKAAEDLKAAQKAQEAQNRQLESVQSAQDLIGAIDRLVSSPGFSSLGTAWGDAQIAVPVIRNDAKDARGQLDTIASQVAMSTLSRLKSLSATGATGFGALSNQELKLIQDSISSLQSGTLSNAELSRSLKTIRDKMEKVANWQPPANAAPAAGGYQIGQIIEANGKRYRITGISDPNDPDVEEVR